MFIVKNLIDDLKGNFEINSELGKYTEFVINIPNKKQITSNIEKLPNVPDSNSLINEKCPFMIKKPLKILIVDDVLINIKIFKKHLTCIKSFLDIDDTTDSRLAINLINDNNYDIVLTDKNMPNVDGYEVAKISKTKNKNTIVIMATADSTKDKNTCIDKILIKPYSKNMLIRLFNYYINQKMN